MSHYKNVKCYGGPLHGEIVAVDGPRIMTRKPSRVRPRYFDPMSQRDFVDTLVETTYTVEVFHERRGTAYHRTYIGVIDGSKNLTQHEEWEIERDLHQLPWEPVDKPSILQHFDSWFNWCAYRHTGDRRHLDPEFQKYRME